MKKAYEHLSAAFKTDYESGLSVWKIGAKYGVPGQAVHSYLKRMGVPRRSLEQAIRKRPINVTVFDAPLTKEAAYWLGQLYANGGISVLSNGFQQIGLTSHSDDVEISRGLLEFLGIPDAPINFRKDKKAVSVSFASKTLSVRLAELGIVPRKSHIIRWPNEITDVLAPHFARGYLDGDGSVYFRARRRYVTKQGTVAFTGNPGFIEDLRTKIDMLTTCGRGTLNDHNPKSPTVGYEGRLKLLALHEWLYGDGGTCLQRKKNRLEIGLGLAPE